MTSWKVRKLHTHTHTPLSFLCSTKPSTNGNQPFRIGGKVPTVLQLPLVSGHYMKPTQTSCTPSFSGNPSKNMTRPDWHQLWFPPPFILLGTITISPKRQLATRCLGLPSHTQSWDDPPELRAGGRGTRVISSCHHETLVGAQQTSLIRDFF